MSVSMKVFIKKYNESFMYKFKYLIYVKYFSKCRGGIVALHKLCHDLNCLGKEAYVLSKETHPKFNAPYLGEKKFDDQETIVVYPEVEKGNPYNAKNVVRWVLNTPGVCSSAEDFYNFKKPSDLIFKYSEFFTLKEESENKGILTTTFVDESIFFDNNCTRKNSCFFIKKGGAKVIIHPPNSIDLSSHEDNFAYMADTFRTTEYFYCYDNACFWVVLAALCGCVSVVVPNSNMKDTEWYKKFPHKRFGVAYGTENITHAINSISLVRENIFKSYELQFNTVEQFSRTVENIFFGRNKKLNMLL